MEVKDRTGIPPSSPPHNSIQRGDNGRKGVAGGGGGRGGGEVQRLAEGGGGEEPETVETKRMGVI